MVTLGEQDPRSKRLSERAGKPRSHWQKLVTAGSGGVLDLLLCYLTRTTHLLPTHIADASLFDRRF